MILVDTSLWIDHFRSGHSELITLLQEGRVCTHPFILGEIACGHLKNRTQTLSLMAGLPLLPAALDNEVLVLIEAHQLMGRGIGYIDAHLLTSVLLAPGVELWSSDSRLQKIASELKVKASH